MEHKYYVDTQDIVTILEGSSRILRHARYEAFHQTIPTNKHNRSRSRSKSQGKDILGKDGQGKGLTRSSNVANFATVIAGGDDEATELIKFIEDSTQISVDKFLQLKRNSYRVYQAEDSSLLTSVYFNHKRDLICGRLRAMANALAHYVRDKFSGKQGTTRLGFSSEKELFNITRRIFGLDIFGQTNVN